MGALARWRAGAKRPPVAELHLGAGGTLALRTHAGAAIELGLLSASAASIEARLRTFDAVWAELDPHERGRARTFHTGARPEHVTVAFAKD
jgi:hypothetical protein